MQGEITSEEIKGLKLDEWFMVEIYMDHKWLPFSDKPMRYEDAREQVKKLEEGNPGLRARWIPCEKEQ